MTQILSRTVLGAGSLSSAAIRIFRANPGPFALAMLLPWLLGLAMNRVLPVEDVEITTDTLDAFGQDIGGGLLAMLAGLIPWVLTAAPVTIMAFSAAAARPVRLGDAYAGTVPIFGRALALTALQTLAFAIPIAGAALIAGGLAPFVAALVLVLWLVGLLFVAMPAAVAGAGPVAAIKRSAALTKGHRWQVLNALMRLVFLIIVISLALTAAVTVLDRVSGAGLMPVLQLGLDAVGTVISAPIYILPALVYLRLADMKEGGDPSRIAEVFE